MNTKLPTDIIEYIFEKIINGDENKINIDRGAAGFSEVDRLNHPAILVDFNKNKYMEHYKNISLTCKSWKYIIDSIVEHIRFSSKKRISPGNLNIFLSKYKNLKSLYFDKCKWLTEDHLPALVNTRLELLSVDETKIESLVKMPVNNVKYLYTRGGVVRAGYNKFPMVEFINASSSSLIDLYVLNTCKELKNIILSFTYVTDISPLLEYNKKLENIDLSFSYA
jgi:hypothetical protein